MRRYPRDTYGLAVTVKRSRERDNRRRREIRVPLAALQSTECNLDFTRRSAHAVANAPDMPRAHNRKYFHRGLQMLSDLTTGWALCKFCANFDAEY